MESEEIMTQEQSPNMPAMHGGVMAQMDKINQGTVAIEASRAIAEAQGKLVIAKRFPRNEVEAYAKAMEKGFTCLLSCGPDYGSTALCLGCG